MSRARSYTFTTLDVCVRARMYVCVVFAIRFICTVLRNEATMMHSNGIAWFSCSYGGAKNGILKNPCLSLTSCLLPCITLACQWHPFSFAIATEDECVRVPRMVAGAQCEFIAAESSTYERWLRFESSEKKNFIFRSMINFLDTHKFMSLKVSFFSKLVAFSIFHSFLFHIDCNF